MVSDVGPCPVCGTPMQLLSTTNEWTDYCPKCDKRFNDRGEAKPDAS